MESMIDALKNPFANDFPTFLESSLWPLASASSDGDMTFGAAMAKKQRRDAGIGKDVGRCLAFSPKGSYLAIGALGTGYVVIRDLTTGSSVAVVACHQATVTCVAFVPNQGGRIILTGSADRTLKAFTLDGFKGVFATSFPYSVVGASICPAGKRCVVSLSADRPDSPKDHLPAKEESSSSMGVPWPQVVSLSFDGKTPSCVSLKWELSAAETKAKPKFLVAVISNDGKFCLVGGYGGDIHVFEAETGNWLRKESPLPSKKNGYVRRLVIGAKGKYLLAQVAEKVLHMLSVSPDGTLTHVMDLQESVEGIKWSACTISPDGEYVIGACSKSHNLHIWNVLGRHMAKLVPPTAGVVRDVLWHPSRPLVASLGNEDQVHLWASHRSQAWSAFAPNFIQLEENIKYHETEDEFDMKGNSKSNGSCEAEEFVDVLTCPAEDPSLKEFALPFDPAPLAVLKPSFPGV